MSALRHLAVTVIQSASKAYRWCIGELTPDGKWSAVDEQEEAAKDYSAAMAAGLVQLQGLVEDLAVGPREEDPEAPPPKRKEGLFGFGFGVPQA
ncbi:hypothetical protein [Variovorax paradoxus]|uniref:hypothetical protein n=1 Tax=Variovorax paradoxus TaxID=34073 RepID=UPI0019319AD4|nr:hypothetical protein INQ48_13775 [Variovorax paradoxus]